MIYLEEKGEYLIAMRGMTKAAFAEKMGIRKQNVKTLLKSKNLLTVRRIAKVLEIPFETLIASTEEPVINEEHYEAEPFVSAYNIGEVTPLDIPVGDSVEEVYMRNQLIRSYYDIWRQNNPDQWRYNVNLRDYINIKSVSIEETAVHASKRYLSTLAVLQLDAILSNAWFIKKVPSKATTKNQNLFESFLIMQYNCPGIGPVKLMVGIKRSDKAKVQYCITSLKSDEL